MSNDDKRPIPRGSCSWCGHEPHDGTPCSRSIRTRVFVVPKLAAEGAS